MSSNATIYVGVWTNWSKGAISGSTLTLPVRDGAILIALLALFIQLSGTQSWSISCFIAHQIRTSKEAKDGIYYQQQATLRNNSSDVATVWRLASIGLAWRSHGIKSTRRSFALIVTGLIHLLAFGAAGLLSSHFTTVGNEVLLARNPTCGALLLLNSTEATNQTGNIEAYLKNSVQTSQQYVQHCLGEQATLPQCNKLKRSRLDWNSIPNVPCPFKSGLCLGLVNSSLYFDSGLIDSREDLGVNGNDANRVQYRKTATCSPLTTDGHILVANGTFGNNTVGLAAAFYGPNYKLPATAAGAEDRLQNATYFTVDISEYKTAYDYIGSSAYSIYTTSAFPLAKTAGFTAIPELSSPNRSVTLVFAVFGGGYTGPNDDLWLAAHVKPDQSFNAFYPDSRINVLACTEQHQFCNPTPSSNRTQKCTPLQSVDQVTLRDPERNASLFDNEYQKAVAQIIFRATMTSSWEFVARALDPSLLAESLVHNGISKPLPNNQWILEAKNWFAIMMANIQQLVADTATSTPGIDPQFTLNPADKNPGMNQYCGNQIIRQDNFSNFSVLGISIIFFFGGIIICVSLVLETVTSYLQIRFQRGLYHQVRWQLDSTLQLQRMAFEGADMGTWSGGAEEVPVTEKCEKLAPATDWDERHPSIRGKSAGKLMPVNGDVGDVGDEVSERNFF